MAKRTEITIERDSLLVLRGRKVLRAWCPGCGSESEMIPVDEVGVISNLPSREVEEWIQSDELHRLKAADGASMICLNSMLKRIRQTATAPRNAKQ